MIDRNAHERSGLSNLLINVGVATATGVTALLYSAYDPKPLEGTFGQNVPRVEESITDYQSKPNVPVAPYEAVEEKRTLSPHYLVLSEFELQNSKELDLHGKAISEDSKTAYKLLDAPMKFRVDDLISSRDNGVYDKFPQIDPSREKDLITPLEEIYSRDFPNHLKDFSDGDFILMGYLQSRISI
jgi:hypothetical protein